MPGFELRPRFRINTSLSAQQIIDQVRIFSQKPKGLFTASVASFNIVLGIPSEKQHYWSPQLNIEIEEQENGCLLRCYFGPSPGLWTMFMFFYMGVAFIGLIGLFFGLSQWSLNITPSGLWIVPIAIVLEIILFAISKTGQKLASEQMDFLHKCLNNSLHFSVNKEI